ncbi:MAG: DedA family protein [Patescibacteria group bacterium]|jgi:membrane protein DedA with SNARE-associated domain
MINVLVNFVTNVIGQVGYAGVFGLMLLESANIPIPSEAIMPFAGFLVARGDLNIWWVVLIGTLGNLVGSMLSYWVGATGGRTLIDKYGKYVRLNHHHLDLTEKWFAKYGESSVFFGRWMPVVRTFVSLPAGLAKMNFTKFSIYTFLGALPFCYLLTWIGYKLGQNWEQIRPYFHYLDLLVLFVVIIWLLNLLLKKRTKPVAN